MWTARIRILTAKGQSTLPPANAGWGRSQLRGRVTLPKSNGRNCRRIRAMHAIGLPRERVRRYGRAGKSTFLAEPITPTTTTELAITGNRLNHPRDVRV